METNNQISDRYDDGIDLRQLFALLWGGKAIIIVTTTVFAIVSVIYALSISDQYKAVAVLSPSQKDSGGLSGALGQLGGLASLAGVSIGGGDSSEAQMAQEIMKSWNFIETFITDNELAVEVYAVEGWNKGSNRLQVDDDIYDVEKKKWMVEDVYTGEEGPPSSWQLFEKFSEKLVIAEDPTLGLISVSIEYYSPQIAKQWLDMFVMAINKHMQERQITKVTTNINYLQEQIEKTSITEMREVFYTIIEEQIKNKMLAEASPEYAFVTVSPSMVPEEKSQPKRALICILGTLLGGMLSVLQVLARHYTKKSD
ncbi:Wzz/FepE/Etk N-terminal domain-containing protein [Porticoccaceae bacterium]|nr:Wzz/FepE/Etk N-terminal domain-containing protein [Porticoccaceae bacterium]